MAFILYIMIVLKLTFFKGTIGTIKYDKMPPIPLKHRVHLMQRVPFRTIASYFIRDESFETHFKELSSSQKLEFVIQNLLGNIILFMPLGILLPVLRRSIDTAGAIVVVSFFASLLIETCQFFLNRGVFDVDDMILNTLGGVLGYGILAIGKRYVKGKDYVKPESG